MVTQGGKFEGREVIDAKALLAAMTAQTISNHSGTLDARPGFYGYGFNVHTTSAGRISIGHSGGFSLGAATNFAILPSVGIGIVVLTNAAPIGVAETLATQFMDLVQFGKIERDWLAGYSAAAGAANGAGRKPGRETNACKARAGFGAFRLYRQLCQRLLRDGPGDPPRRRSGAEARTGRNRIPAHALGRQCFHLRAAQRKRARWLDLAGDLSDRRRIRDRAGSPSNISTTKAWGPSCGNEAARSFAMNLWCSRTLPTQHP